jgi:hypothetical protein
MPTTVNCPSCQRSLGVPDALMGKRVKCPSCSMVFTATPPGSAPGEEHDVAGYPLDSESEASARRRSPAPSPDEDADEEQPRVRKRAARRREDYDEDDGGSYGGRAEEEYEEEDDVYYRRRSRRRRAREMVAAPAIALMAVGGTGAVVNLLAMCFFIMMALNTPAPDPKMMAQPGFSFGFQLGKYSWAIVAFLGICLGGVMFLSAWKMKNLESYGYALTASIIALLPCQYCCIIAIPFGIWALIVLNDPDVKSAFR